MYRTLIILPGQDPVVPRLSPRTVALGDVTLAYCEYGSGYPVIFIGGLGSTMDTWNPPVVEAIAEHFRVILFDNRGTGYSTGLECPFSIPLFARDTALLMEALHIPSAHIIGHSMGASVAQELALTFPERVTRVVLVSGTCGGADAVQMQPAVRARLTDKSGTVQDVIDRMFSLLFPAPWLARHDPLRYCPELEEPVPDDAVAARQAEAFFTWTGSFTRLGQIRSPTLIITGTEDVIVPPVNSHILHERIAGSVLAEIPGTGHGLMYQEPDRFSSCVLSFLTR